MLAKCENNCLAKNINRPNVEEFNYANFMVNKWTCSVYCRISFYHFWWNRFKWFINIYKMLIATYTTGPTVDEQKMCTQLTSTDFSYSNTRKFEKPANEPHSFICKLLTTTTITGHIHVRKITTSVW